MEYNFYTIVSLIAVVLLILGLTGVGLVMSNSYNTKLTNGCPNNGVPNPDNPNSKYCNSY